MRSICAVVILVCSFTVFAEEEKAVNDAQFHKTLLEIASCYERFGRVDDMARWAPWLCRMPSPSMARESTSKDERTHGRKLYFVFASDRKQYLAQTESNGANELGHALYDEIAPGSDAAKAARADFARQMNQRIQEPSAEILKHFVIVKESWTPKEVGEKEVWGVHSDGKFTKNDVELLGGKEGELYCRDRVAPFVIRDGKFFKTDHRGPLFIMYRTEKNAPGTDNGWVYGTLTSDGKTVTSAGRVASCMGCHTEAPYPKEPKGEGRLFGLPEKVKKKEN